MNDNAPIWLYCEKCDKKIEKWESEESRKNLPRDRRIQLMQQFQSGPNALQCSQCKTVYAVL